MLKNVTWQLTRMTSRMIKVILLVSGVTIGPADPALQGVPFKGVPKFHLSDGRRTKSLKGGIKNPDLTSDDGRRTKNSRGC